VITELGSTYIESTPNRALILLFVAQLLNPVSKAGSPATAEGKTDLFNIKNY
jgi:hypothetical protein